METKLETLKSKLSFIKKRGVRPILGNVKISKDGLTCTDLETYLFIKESYGLKEGFQGLEVLGLVPSVSDIDYPTIDFNIDNPADHVTVKLEDLFYCNKFASSDETRLYLNCVAFDNSHMVGINGHIMKTYKTKELSKSYLIPKTSLKILEALTKTYKIKGMVTISFDSDFATIHTEFFKFKARLIQREFPKWQSVVPAKYLQSVKLSGIPKMSLVKPLLNKSTKAVKIECLEGKILLSVPNHDLKFNLGTHESDFCIGVNMEYLETASNGLNTVELKFNNSLSPLLINEAIVMPLRV